jgi:hypothetical protein
VSRPAMVAAAMAAVRTASWTRGAVVRISSSRPARLMAAVALAVRDEWRSPKYADKPKPMALRVTRASSASSSEVRLEARAISSSTGEVLNIQGRVSRTCSFGTARVSRTNPYGAVSAVGQLK